MSTMNAGRLLNTEDLAELLGKPHRTLDQWRYQGRGPAYIKVGGSVRYALADVEAWLDAQRVATDTHRIVEQ
jgi:predicted DNA-binding transcriptional regulator AlpA